MFGLTRRQHRDTGTVVRRFKSGGRRGRKQRQTPGGGSATTTAEVVGTFAAVLDAEGVPAAQTLTYADLTTDQQTALVAALGRTPDDDEVIVMAGISTATVVGYTIVETGDDMFLVQDPSEGDGGPIYNFAGVDIHGNRLIGVASINGRNFVWVDPCV